MFFPVLSIRGQWATASTANLRGIAAMPTLSYISCILLFLPEWLCFCQNCCKLTTVQLNHSGCPRGLCSDQACHTYAFLTPPCFSLCSAPFRECTNKVPSAQHKWKHLSSVVKQWNNTWPVILSIMPSFYIKSPDQKHDPRYLWTVRFHFIFES